MPLPSKDQQGLQKRKPCWKKDNEACLILPLQNIVQGLQALIGLHPYQVSAC